jgi:tetratricopeptide (TPR) repeat protein
VISYQIDLELTNYHIGCRYGLFGRYNQALKVLGEAREFFERMERENPKEPRSLQVLPPIWRDIGGVLRDMRLDLEALAAFEQSIDSQKRAFDQAQSDAVLRRTYAHRLVTDYEQRAAIEVRLNRPTDARRSLSTAIEFLRTIRDASPGTAFIEARLYCRLIARIDEDQRRLRTDQHDEREALARLACNALRNAFPTCYQSIKHLKEDKTFDAIRSEADFQLLMMDMAFPANPIKP